MILSILQKAQRNTASISFAQSRCFATVAPHSRIPREKNYYSILGLERTATPEQIKEAYRELAKQYHPDITGGTTKDAEKFRDVMEAYGILSVKESRVNYDLSMKRNPDQYKEMS